MHARLLLGLVGAAAVTLALMATSAAAVTTQMPVTQTFFNACANETFTATGTLVANTDVTISPDGKFHTHSNMSFHGMSATALVTGHKYVVQDQTIDGTNEDSDAMPATTHTRIKIHYVRTGEDGTLFPDDDFYEWFTIHMTINANGVPTSTNIDTSDDPCR